MTGGIDVLAHPVSFDTWIAVAVSVGFGVVLAIALRWGIRLLQKQALKTAWRFDDLVLKLIRLTIPFCVIIGGIWGGVRIIPLKPGWHTNIDHLMLALMVAVVTIAVARVAGELVQNRALSHSGTSGSATIFVNITRVVVIALGLLLLLNALGIAITPLLTALGVGGIAVALALQDTLENLFAGVHILASHQIQPGAYIMLDNGMEGYVEDTNWRNTVIRQTSNNFVVVPNNTLAQSILTNYHQPSQQMSVPIPVGVSYSSDLDHVEQVALEVGRDVMANVDGGVPEHEPIIRFDAFGDSSITFKVILRTSEATLKSKVIHEFIKRAHRRFNAEGIDMPFPIITLHRPDSAGVADSRELISAGLRERGLD